MATKYIQMSDGVLQSAIDTVATTAVFTEFIDLAGVPLVQTDFGDFGYGTLEPNTAREESVRFVITANTTGTATVTLTRGLRGKAPYGTGGTAFAHNGGAKLVISNTPDFLNQFTAKDNAENVTSQWSFPTPTGPSSPATKQYADGLVALGGAEATATTRGISILSASPNVTIGAATISIATPAVISFTAHGLISSDSIIFTTTGALPTGLTASTTYFVMTTGLTANTFQVSATLGGVAINTSGTQSGVQTLIEVTPIAVGFNDTTKLPTVTEKLALVGGGVFGTPSGSNKYVTESYVTDPSRNQVFSANGTWTKPSNISFVEVICIGSGGGGGGGRGAAAGIERGSGGGGGGGSVTRAIFPASVLGASIAVSVGVGGTGGNGGTSAVGASGVAGNTSSFGTRLRAFGGGFGGGGDSATAVGGGGGGSAAVGGNAGAGTSTGGSPQTVAGAAGISGQGAGSPSTNSNGNSAEWGGGAGASGSAGGNPSFNGGSSLFSGGGGGGGGKVAFNDAQAGGGAGGNSQAYTSGGGAAGGSGANGSNGSVGVGFAGTGGGGGGGNAGGTGYSGGVGGVGGGGGGGGGGLTVGGGGGAGGVGEVRVYCW